MRCPARCQYGDAGRASIDVEPKLPEPAVELPCVRLVEQRPVFGEEVDVERRPCELRVDRPSSQLRTSVSSSRYPRP